MKMKAAALLVLTLASTSVMAHPQVSGSLLHGFVHPFTGADHVAAMLIVGLWAARRRGASRLVLPLAFLGSMLAGALIAALDLRLPAVEPIAAVSVLVFAAALVAALRIPLSASAALVSVFALFHGYTHINGAAFIGGMLAGTALLLALGFAIGLAIAARRPGFA